MRQMSQKRIDIMFSISDMFMSTLFKPGTKINPEHRPKYVHILAYASCATETYKKVSGSFCQTFNTVSVSYPFHRVFPPFLNK